MMRLATDDAFGLVADDGQDPIVSRGCGDGCKYPVEGFRHDGGCGSAADAPRDRFVDEVGRGYLPDVGLAADPLALARSCARRTISAMLGRSASLVNSPSR